MQKNFFHRVVLCCLLLGLQACAGRKHLTSRTESGTWKPVSEAQRRAYEQQVQAYHLNFDGLVARSKGFISLWNGDQHDVQVQIRLQAGEAIWASFTAMLGTEVARVLLTPDSIRIIHRLERWYLGTTYQDLLQSVVDSASLSDWNFHTLQHMLVGNVSDSSRRHHMEFALFEHGKGAGYRDSYAEWYTNSNYRLESVRLRVGDSFEWRHHYQTPPTHGSYPGFPVKSTISLPGLLNLLPGTLTLTLDYQRLEAVQRVELPFQIPKGYKSVH